MQNVADVRSLHVDGRQSHPARLAREQHTDDVIDISSSSSGDDNRGDQEGGGATLPL